MVLFALPIGWWGFILGLFAIARTQAGWRFSQANSRKWLLASGILFGVAHLALISGLVLYLVRGSSRSFGDPAFEEQMNALARSSLFSGLGLGLLVIGLMMLPLAFAIYRRSKLPGQGHFDDRSPIPFNPAIAIVLHFLLAGVFTTFKLGLMHGQLPYRRPDDPTAGKAIGFLFIPFFNLYWIFFANNRLAVRINEELAARGLSRRVSPELAIITCVLMLVPFLGVVAWAVMWPIVLGTYQTAMNELAHTPAPKDSDLALAA